MLRSSTGDSVPISFVVYQSSKLFRSPQTSGGRSAASPGFIDSQVIAAYVEGVRVENLPVDSPVVTAFLQNTVR